MEGAVDWTKAVGMGVAHAPSRRAGINIACLMRRLKRPLAYIWLNAYGSHLEMELPRARDRSPFGTSVIIAATLQGPNVAFS